MNDWCMNKFRTEHLLALDVLMVVVNEPDSKFKNLDQSLLSGSVVLIDELAGIVRFCVYFTVSPLTTRHRCCTKHVYMTENHSQFPTGDFVAGLQLIYGLIPFSLGI